jgi:hypothetical protein
MEFPLPTRLLLGLLLRGLRLRYPPSSLVSATDCAGQMPCSLAGCATSAVERGRFPAGPWELDADVHMCTAVPKLHSCWSMTAACLIDSATALLVSRLSFDQWVTCHAMP